MGNKQAVRILVFRPHLGNHIPHARIHVEVFKSEPEFTLPRKIGNLTNSHRTANRGPIPTVLPGGARGRVIVNDQIVAHRLEPQRAQRIAQRKTGRTRANDRNIHRPVQLCQISLPPRSDADNRVAPTAMMTDSDALLV